MSSSSRGFGLFTAEAMLALLSATTIAILFSQSATKLPSYSTLYKYELLQDFLEIGARKYNAEIVAFAEGNADAENSLRESYGRVLENFGNYCLQMEAKGKKLEINCDGGEKRSEKLSGTRIFFDGKDFFEMRMTLS